MGIDSGMVKNDNALTILALSNTSFPPNRQTHSRTFSMPGAVVPRSCIDAPNRDLSTSDTISCIRTISRSPEILDTTYITRVLGSFDLIFLPLMQSLHGKNSSKETYFQIIQFAPREALTWKWIMNINCLEMFCL